MIQNVVQIILLWMIMMPFASGQDPLRFDGEVKELIAKDDGIDKEALIVFTGSSSVRFWPDLEITFEGKNVINRGFGGSTMTDLIYYQEALILKHRPDKVFIYEGDNDISLSKTPEEILMKAKELVSTIHGRLPDTEVYFISPKPSVARWDLKEVYKQFNYSLKAWASFEDKVHFIDVWTPMCDDTGEVLDDLFIADNLHMNTKGYRIWRRVILPYVIED